MARIEATPTPSVLAWARNSAGMSVEFVAQKSGVKVEQILSWEAGTSRPSIPQLRKLAVIYRRPLATFYLVEPPIRFEVMHDFRRLSSSTVPPERSPQLAFEIRRAFDRREWALELMEDIDELPRIFEPRATMSDNSEAVAERLRKFIEVTLEQQAARRVDSDAFKSWRRVLEHAGILTLQSTTLQMDQARGFSISLKPLPVVVVNIKDAYRGRIFTLLHEAVHIMLNEGGICDLHDGDTEAFCNRVAGATLFPKEALLATPTVRQHRKGDPVWTDYELQEISRQFGGSREAALVRLLTLRLTTQPYYERISKQFHAKYEEIQKKKQESEGFAPPHVVAISSAGPLFTGLVIENFNREKITASDVSDFLQIRLKHLKEVQGEVAKEALSS